MIRLRWRSWLLFLVLVGKSGDDDDYYHSGVKKWPRKVEKMEIFNISDMFCLLSTGI